MTLAYVEYLDGVSEKGDLLIQIVRIRARRRRERGKLLLMRGSLLTRQRSAMLSWWKR
jgi:hypothetical protein